VQQERFAAFAPHEGEHGKQFDKKSILTSKLFQQSRHIGLPLYLDSDSSKSQNPLTDHREDVGGSRVYPEALSLRVNGV